jgi:membrane protein implicated in regulation of membrane protease activity
MSFRISLNKKTALTALAIGAVLLFLWSVYAQLTEGAAIAGAMLTAWIRGRRAEAQSTADNHTQAQELSEELSKRTEAESTEAHRDGTEEARKWLDRPF